MISSAGSIGIMVLGFALTNMSDAGKMVYNIFYNIFFYMMAINVILWVLDIFNALFKTFKIPVVLAKKGEKHD